MTLFLRLVTHVEGLYFIDETFSKLQAFLFLNLQVFNHGTTTSGREIHV